MVDIDGETVRKRVRFETTDPLVAKRKIQRMASEALPVSVATAAATFWEEAEAVHAERVARGVHRPDIEIGRIKNHVRAFVGALSKVPFGDRALGAISADEVTELLTSQRNAGYSRQQVKHIRNYLKYVFESRKLDTLDRVPLPIFKATVAKERAVLEDAELLTYLGYQHPVERFRTAVLMRQAMSCIARCFGGQRTNDLHVATWDMFEIAGGAFPRGWVPRTKGKQPQRLTVPEGLRPVLRLWWEHQGCPTSGPLFPLLRGEHIGGARVIQDSHAEALRKDLMRAFGIFVWDPTGGKKKSGCWVKARELSERERELFVESAYTKPVEFHSHRRAWSQALERVGVNVQTSAALTGHASDLRAHSRYLANSRRERSVPEGVVPDLTAKTIFGRGLANIHEEGFGVSSDSSDVSGTSERARVGSNHRPLASEAEPRKAKRASSFTGATSEALSSDVERPGTTERGQNSRPEFPGPLLLSTDALTELLTLATRAKRFDLVKALAEQIEAAPEAGNVTSLDAARRNRGKR